MNLFGEMKLLPTFKELLGLEGAKPFECVGTPEETQLAFCLAHEKKECADEPMMAMFLENFRDKLDSIKNYQQLTFSGRHLFPPSFDKIIENET